MCWCCFVYRVRVTLMSISPSTTTSDDQAVLGLILDTIGLKAGYGLSASEMMTLFDKTGLEAALNISVGSFGAVTAPQPSSATTATPDDASSDAKLYIILPAVFGVLVVAIVAFVIYKRKYV